MSEIKVLMVGASRSGKSSILASMKQHCDDNLLRQFSLDLGSDEAFIDEIRIMRDLCSDPNTERMTSLYGTREKKDYRFHLGYNGAGAAGKNDIVITDVPGELFASSAPKVIEEIEDIVKKCQILIVAVDTQAMLWALNNATNNLDIICCNEHLPRFVSLLGSAIDDGNNTACIKSIIFAPIKCENLIHEDEKKFIEDITNAVKNVYARVIENAAGRYKVSIIPMETIGGVEFSRHSERDKMKVLNYKNLDDTAEMGKEYEDISSERTADGDVKKVKITRCELKNANLVKIARTGSFYTLKDGDILVDICSKNKYPYVYAKDRPLPYLWYKANGRGYCPKNCEKVLYEVVRITVQQIALSAGIYDIQGFINRRFNIFQQWLIAIASQLFGITNTLQVQKLCESLKKMYEQNVFNNTIILVNNVDDGINLKR